MTPIYFISGIGADERAFRLISLPGYEIRNVSWLEPLKNENLKSYSIRLSSQITTEDPIIIGLSFGGIIAQEIALHIKTKKVIIISSLKNRKELPSLYKIAAALRLNRIIPSFFFKRSTFITNVFFGARGKNDKMLLKNILSGTDTKFLQWAIENALHWNPENTSDIIHIHGTKDKIIPIRYVKPDYVINGGNHLMVLNKARELSALLVQVLK